MQIGQRSLDRTADTRDFHQQSAVRSIFDAIDIAIQDVDIDVEFLTRLEIKGSPAEAPIKDKRISNLPPSIYSC